MSTELLENDAEGVYLTRFFGGEKRGLSFQITTANSNGAAHVELTDKQMAEVCSAYILSKVCSAYILSKGTGRI